MSSSMSSSAVSCSSCILLRYILVLSSASHAVFFPQSATRSLPQSPPLRSSTPSERNGAGGSKGALDHERDLPTRAAGGPPDITKSCRAQPAQDAFFSDARVDLSLRDLRRSPGDTDVATFDLRRSPRDIDATFDLRRSPGDIDATFNAHAVDDLRRSPGDIDVATFNAKSPGDIDAATFNAKSPGDIDVATFNAHLWTARPRLPKIHFKDPERCKNVRRHVVLKGRVVVPGAFRHNQTLSTFSPQSLCTREERGDLLYTETGRNGAFHTGRGGDLYTEIGERGCAKRGFRTRILSITSTRSNTRSTTGLHSRR